MTDMDKLFTPGPNALWTVDARIETRPVPRFVTKMRHQLARNGGYYRQRWMLGVGQ